MSETLLWIIEAKASRKDISLATEEAIEYYARPINDQHGALSALLASGVAGNESSGYFVDTRIRIAGKWRPVTINGCPATGFLSPKDVAKLRLTGGFDIADFSPSQQQFLHAAERINELLHLGGINKNDRAKTMAALLLSVMDQPPNLDTPLPVLIGEINLRTESILKAHGKPDFAPFVKILPPTNVSNHIKFRSALISTIQELQNLNIRSAMNSSTDILGQFYEVFLKYGNGAKEIGIVLTPRHVTRFAVEAVGVSPNDIVLDPACGTGGFLVAALDHVRRTGSKKQFDRFKRYNLFGIEQESYVAVLAIVNMIFRGDGKHNISESNCLTTSLQAKTIDDVASAEFTREPPEAGKEPVTRVLMNPPFALVSSKEREFHFVAHALGLMSQGGVLFSLLPLNAMFGAAEERIWREKDLLAKHTLLAVMSLPHELFYPAAQKQVLAIVVKAGVPHPKAQSVFWGCVTRDGHLKVKSKRLPAAEMEPPRQEPNQLSEILPHLRAFLAQPTSYEVNVPQFCKTAPVDFHDPLLELVPEAYVDSKPISSAELDAAIASMARDMAAFLIQFGLEDRVGEVDEES